MAHRAEESVMELVRSAETTHHHSPLPAAVAAHHSGSPSPATTAVHPVRPPPPGFIMSRSGQPPDLKKYMDKQLQIKLNANRIVVGTLRGFDQFMNLVIDNTMEVNGEEKTDIGMVVIRGNSVVTVEALEPVSKAQ
ncbi:hypothetical protein R6Q59_036849 [Mikania micrantha]